MAIRYLDGRRLQRSFIAGANAVNVRRDHLNAINVFPVPDGDTGTNMAATLTYAADGIAHLENPTLDEVRQALARAVLVGARGNSGFIISQFLRGFLEGIGEGARRIHRSELARAGQRGSQRAYEALMEPVEGTILTVMREWSRAVTNLSHDLKDIRTILDGALERACLALEHTREQMALLKEHKVVDAGAQGFVHLLEGISEFMHRGTLHQARSAPLVLPFEGMVDAAERAGPLTYRYCTSVLLEEVSEGIEQIKARLSGQGDSLVISGDAAMMKVHIHTDDPEALQRMLAEIGTVVESGAEDMQAQTAAVAATRTRVIKAAPRQTVGIVIDSTCDLLPDQAAEAGLAVVPCQIIFGEDTYRDRVDLSNQRFYELLRRHPEHPKTSQPSPTDFQDAYEAALGEFEHVVSIHLSAHLSGTYQGAVTAAREVSEERITVVDTGTLSLSMGLMGLQTARMARQGNNKQELEHRLREMSHHTRLYCMFETLDYLVRGGRISKFRGWMGRSLGLLPVITVREGVIDTVDKARGSDRGMEIIFERLAQEIPEGAAVVAMAGHCANPDRAGEVADRFTEVFRPREMGIADIGPAVGAHAGPGAWGIFFLHGPTA